MLWSKKQGCKLGTFVFENLVNFDLLCFGLKCKAISFGLFENQLNFNSLYFGVRSNAIGLEFA